MSRNLKSMALCLLLFPSFTIQASPITVAFTCTVENFINTDLSVEAELVDANLRRKFVLSIEEKEVIVTSINETASSSVARYNILSKSFFGQIEAARDDILFYDVISINPKRGSATRSLQDASSVTAWSLDCKK